MVALTYEDKLGVAYFSLDRDYSFLKKEMVEYAMDYLSRVEEDGTRSLRAIINDDDTEMREIVAARGFSITDRQDPITEFRVAGPFPDITLPRGFELVSLAEENDLWKIEKVLWRVDHPGEPPSDLPGTKNAVGHFRKISRLPPKSQR